MPLDPSIILGVKPAQIDFSQFSPINSLIGALKIKTLGQEGELNALRLNEGQGLSKFMAGKPDLSDPNVRVQLATSFGEPGRKVSTGLIDIDKGKTEQIKNVKDKVQLVGSLMAGVTDQASWQRARSQLVKLDPNQDIPETYDSQYVSESMQAALGAEKALERQFTPQDLGSTKNVLAIPKYGTGPATVVEGSTGQVATPFAQLLNERNALAPNDPRVAQYNALITKQTTHPSATTVNVSTEKKYGEAFGSKIADVDVKKFTTAEASPAMAENANRIIGLLKQGDVFTGPAADVKLNIARVLNIAGADNNEKIANTESLIAGIGRNTLDAIASSNLGTGQGFTQKDKEFLQGIAGGTINLTSTTLSKLATLQHQVAVRSAESWNKRVQEIPKEVLQGTGMSITPIKVPGLSAGKSTGTAPPAGAIEFLKANPATRAQFEQTFPGVSAAQFLGQ